MIRRESPGNEDNLDLTRTDLPKDNVAIRAFVDLPRDDEATETIIARHGT